MDNQMMNQMMRICMMQMFQNAQNQQRQQQQQEVTNRMLEMQMQMNNQILQVLTADRSPSTLAAPPSNFRNNAIELSNVTPRQAILAAPASQIVDVTDEKESIQSDIAPTVVVDKSFPSHEEKSVSECNESTQQIDDKVESTQQNDVTVTAEETPTTAELAATAALKRKADTATTVLTRSKFKKIND